MILLNYSDSMWNSLCINVGIIWSENRENEEENEGVMNSVLSFVHSPCYLEIKLPDVFVVL